MPKYHVLVTLYGVGGSYHFGEGLVFVKVKPEGIFSYQGASATTIHEIVHIGIEENIVNKFKLSHWEKEYLVDSICSIYLKDILPEYKFQKDIGKKLHPDRKDSGMTAPDIAGFVTEEAIVLDLPLTISNFVREYPR